MPDNSIPQFNTAEYNQPSAETCKVCGVPLTGTFYRANTAAVCGSCAERVKREIPLDNHARFVRAVLFGLGGFAAALIAYSVIGILLRGWTIGYLALGVGWVVGKAMISGSGGVGGRRYQIVAALLTYAAVSISAIPIGLSLARTESQSVQQSAPESGRPSNQSAASGSQDPTQSSAESGGGSGHKKMSVASALGMLALLGLASPFFELQDGFGGVLMLIILFVGMNFAWKMTAGRGTIEVTGPYEKPASASA